MNDLKNGEPFFERWFIKECIESISSGSLYLIYCIENGVYEYSMMKVIGVPNVKQELKQVQFQELEYDSSAQYYKELVTDLYQEICLIEELNDKSYLISYKEHMIFQRGNGLGYDVFLRMEYLPNITKGLQISALSDQEILQLGKDICDALYICEIYHIIHGDLRPETIFVTENGSFKLGDFSFSRYAKQEEVLYELKDIGDYMAPEVYQGKVYDIRSDIYSLGLILYQLLNDNKLPYLMVPLHDATTTERELAIKLRFENPMLPNPVHATEELAKVIAKACDLNPKRRYQRPEEFKDALTAISVFLDSDLLFKDKGDFFTPEDIYIKNEVVVETSLVPGPDNGLEEKLHPTNLKLVRAKERKQEEVKEENRKNMGPWILIFITLVLTASIIVLLTKVDFTKQVRSSYVEASSKNPPLFITESPSSVVEPTKEPTEQPTIKPLEEPTAQPTVIPDTEPTLSITDGTNMITIVKSGKELTSLEVVTGLDKAIAIDLSNNKLTEIDGLKEAVCVETLVLNHNQIVNVEPLHTLTKLKALDISNNSVSSLIKLRNLEQLEILSASNNLITSLEGIEKMTALKVLYLNGNSIQDITVLKELASLEMIDLSNNKVKAKDIRALRKALPECIIIN